MANGVRKGCPGSVLCQIVRMDTSNGELFCYLVAESDIVCFGLAAVECRQCLTLCVLNRPCRIYKGHGAAACQYICIAKRQAFCVNDCIRQVVLAAEAPCCTVVLKRNCGKLNTRHNLHAFLKQQFSSILIIDFYPT